MNERIELFKMILERNELCRNKWNAYQRYAYTFKRYYKGKHENLELVKDRAITARATKELVQAFTKKTRKRRIQLAISLKTKQYKSTTNVIQSVMASGKRYDIAEMKQEVKEYKIEQILLGRDES